MIKGEFEIGHSVFHPEEISINNAVMRALGRAVADIPNLKTWEFILEDQKNDEDSPHYLLHYYSVDGIGQSCAYAKMTTLRNHPEIVNTKDMENRELGSDEVSWYGGINVKYVGYEGSDSKRVEGVSRLVFSGAREAIDLVIVLKVLKAYMESCDVEIKDATYIYNLEGLRSDQLSGYLMSVIF